MNKTLDGPYRGMTVLLVDDDMDFLEQLKLYFSKLGFSLLTADSQFAGEKLIGEESYDLAVFDLMLENQDSGFILSYRSKQRHPDTPVIMISGVTGETGLQFDASTDESRNWLKADVLLEKDIRYEQLERELERLFPDLA